MGLFEEVKETVQNNSTEEILKMDLKNFFFLDNRMDISYQDLKEMYEKEKINEFRRPLTYFEENINDIKKNILHYQKIYEMLADEESKHAYVNMMAAKLYMNVEYIEKAFSMEETYFSKKIFSFKNDVYIDCGAYNGDTLCQFYNDNPDMKNAYLFEGMEELADVCRKKISEKNITDKVKVYSKAVQEKKKVVYFDSLTKHGDSKIEENGSIEVQAISLDDEITEPVTFIKMDIEGSEKEALLGAKDIIKRYTPKMAICIYHLKDDFWKIPELILKINPNYTFKVRQHDIIALAETVLYCVPDDMEKPYVNEEKKWSKEDADLMAYRRDNAWFMKQMRAKNRCIDNLSQDLKKQKKWEIELKEGKEYLENQCIVKQQRIDELQNWCEEQDKSIQWFKGIQNENEKKVQELEDQKREADEEIQKFRKTEEEMIREKERLQNQLNYEKRKMEKIKNHKLLKFLIEKKNLDV